MTGVEDQQDSAKLDNFLTSTKSQARKIYALKSKVAQLELISTPATVVALQDDPDTLCRDMDYLCSAGITAFMAQDDASIPPTPLETQIHVVVAGSSSVFNATFKEKYTPTNRSINSFPYV